jgi:hypothetical protein
MSAKNPTFLQVRTLDHLIDGWELIDGHWHTGEDRVYWKFKTKLPNGVVLNDTMEAGYPKEKRWRMGLLEKYGWVVKVGDHWEITDLGRKTYEEHKI